MLAILPAAHGHEPARTLRVFLFAGQSNMVGSHSRAGDIERYPPFAGLDEPQPDVRFHYSLGRQDRNESPGWVPLAPVDGVLGPEVSFGSRLSEQLDDPIAIIKVATGGTTLGEDWNPSEPGGLKLYPLALRRVEEALAALTEQGVDYRVEGLVWHQGENDMFHDEFRAAYEANLAEFLAAWRRDLELPELHAFIGGHCTKTIWGMDHRTSMYAIDRAQRAVCDADAHATFVPTAHVAVELDNQAGLHYHYGTLGQLEHGATYAAAYLARVGEAPDRDRPLRRWPYRDGEPVRLLVFCGHRSMEGEAAFTQQLADLPGGRQLEKDDDRIAFRYSLGGGLRTSNDWEPLGPVGFCDTFGPELSFAAELGRTDRREVAIVKYTSSGSQLNDWSHEIDACTERHEFPRFIAFVREAIASLEARGHEVELGPVFYHLGENDTAWYPHRKATAQRLAAFVADTRVALEAPQLRFLVSQQQPAQHESVDRIDVLAEVAALAAADPLLLHVPVLDLPGDNHPLQLRTEGVVALGRRLAEAFRER